MFRPKIAKDLGVNCAVILYHIGHWIEKNRATEKHFVDGYTWTYGSANELSIFFEFMTERQVRTAIDKLRNEGMILAEQLEKEKQEMKFWYTLTKKFYEKYSPNETNLVPDTYQPYQECQIDLTSRSNGLDTEVECMVTPMSDVPIERIRIIRESPKRGFFELRDKFQEYFGVSKARGKKAEKCFNEINPDEQTFRKMMIGLDDHKAEIDGTKKMPLFLSTYLCDRFYETYANLRDKQREKLNDEISEYQNPSVGKHEDSLEARRELFEQQDQDRLVENTKEFKDYVRELKQQLEDGKITDVRFSLVSSACYYRDIVQGGTIYGV